MVTVAIKTDASNINNIIAKNIRIRKESRLIFICLYFILVVTDAACLPIG
jgi:hypothetical protein